MAENIANLVQDVNIGTASISNISDGTINGAIVKHEDQLGGSTAIYFRKDGNGKWGYSESPTGTITNFKNPTGNAPSSAVLSGYTFATSVSDANTGSMSSHSAVKTTISAGDITSWSAGYSPAGWVRAETLANQTTVDSGKNATQGRILNSYQAWVNGNKITGNMVNNGAVSGSINLNSTYTIPAGYHNGNGTVTQSLTATTRSVTLSSSPGTVAQTLPLTTAATRYNTGVTVNVKDFYNASTAQGAVNGYTKGSVLEIHSLYGGSASSQKANATTLASKTLSAGTYSLVCICSAYNSDQRVVLTLGSNITTYAPGSGSGTHYQRTYVDGGGTGWNGLSFGATTFTISSATATTLKFYAEGQNTLNMKVAMIIPGKVY